MTQNIQGPSHLPAEVQHSALLQLLTNSLILCHTTPYLSCYDVLNLGATSRAFRYLVHHTPQVFRRLELATVKAAQFDIDAIDHGGQTWRNVRVDESLTEDDFYSGPLRGIFSSLRRHDILRDVQVLSLDGLSVTAELIHDILIDPSYAIRILSIRDARNLNERKLRASLKYACRESRATGTPKLKGLYVFGPKDAAPGLLSTKPTVPPTAGVASTWNNKSQKALTADLVDEPEAWYARRGQQFPRRISSEWAATLIDCDGVIAFDAVLCTGPRHLNSPAWGTVSIEALDAASNPASRSVPHYGVATHSLGGCASCGAAPEGWTVWGEDRFAAARDACERRTSNSSSSDIGRFPLLAPPPMHSSNLKAAMCPTGQSIKSRLSSLSSTRQEKARFIPRCFDCIRDRYCASCCRWWCENCYLGPWASGLGGHGGATDTEADLARVTKSCWECGMNCHECIDFTQRMCHRCGGGYCLIHNEGSNMIACDCKAFHSFSH
ncbi:hypothetical protein QBC37DRAFT_204196 [Rhypophila decipiens]|uniref:F-box domain-containing protein n=1 Tax=Rhypophila decipiens TaxID=261697 RepID=A0AAN6Y3D1_9PEZI|nr:hypothetical protein QBC37DRAFT_204196 [Rhypophila decipiens]